MSFRSDIRKQMTLERLAWITWYLLALYLAVAYVRGPLVSAWPHPLRVVQAVVGLLVVTALLLLIPAAAKAVSTAPASHGHPFPTSVTVVVGVWLMVFSLAAAAGLLCALFPPSWLSDRLSTWGFSTSATVARDASNALVTVFAAAVGSAITTIQGYLRHASTDEDFKASYAPWYVARPLMGMLLGLLFYLVLKAGFLLLTTAPQDPIDSQWGLAAVGGLVGLSSKNAIDKLKEVFQTMFRTASAESADESPTREWTVSQLNALIADPDE